VTVALVLVAVVAVVAQVVALAPPSLRTSDGPAGDAAWWQRMAAAVRRHPVASAVVVGGVLRLVWVILATRTPPFITDPSEYLRIAVELTHGRSPTFGGVGGPSAYWPPGYPAVLVPFVGFAEWTGWLSVAFAASLVNAAAGTLSVLLAGRLAMIWFGRRAAVWAAWLVALCPALIFFTSTAHSDTVFIALLLGVLVVIGRPRVDESWSYWGRVGLLLGVACLVRVPALVLAPVPALALRSQYGSWAGAARSTAIVAGGAAVVLVPWLVRNGVQVGVWSPGSTNNAAAVCFGQNDRARPDWATSLADLRLQRECFGGSPYADPRLIRTYRAEGNSWLDGLDAGELRRLSRIDEGTWYSTRMHDAVHWALTHPLDSASLSVRKGWVIWRSEGDVVDSARNYAESGWAGRWQTPLGVLANVWLWGVSALAVAGLVLVPACRRTTVVWVPVVLLTLSIVLAVAEPHYRLPANPLVAVLAAGAIVGLRTREESGDALA
jgi:4-amino-4-deoxy-L-arabinose transferase-like glycosyltransferase